jgi:gas vesicle protein
MTEKIDSNAGYFLAGLTIGSLIGIFFAPKSGEGTREYLSKKAKEGGKHAARRLRNSESVLKTWSIPERNWLTKRKKKSQRNWTRP